jgi:uncharacterized protein YgbK (DUF1537 family)
VLDDDPTGTQAMAGVPVVLRLEPDAMRAASRGRSLQAIHLVTNSRALTPRGAARVVGRAARDAVAVWPRADLVLRGDSTLRGHVAEEYEALRTVRYPDLQPTLLLVPALPAAGRITVGGVHLLEREGERRPLHATEYARDRAFAYDDARLLVWAERRSGGRFRADRGLEVHLDDLRRDGGAAVADALIGAGTHGRARSAGPVACAVDAETDADLRSVAEGYCAARAAGAPVILRCAPSLAGILGGATADAFAPMPAGRGRVLLVCGSYVPTATRQLAVLLDGRAEALVEASPDGLMAGAGAAEVRRLVAAVDRRLTRDGFAVLATPRAQDGAPGDLDRQATVAAGIATVVRRLPRPPTLVITKGGVTSAVTVRDGLGASGAEVVGPVLTGVSHWLVQRVAGGVVQCLVVPGNVGDDALLDELVTTLGVRRG